MSQAARQSKRRRISLKPAAPSVQGETVVPEDYRPDALDYICEQISAGHALEAICLQELMPNIQIVRRWLANDPAFKGRVLDAMRVHALTEGIKLIEIADDVNHSVQRQRLRINTRQWLLGKLEPEAFGDRVEHGHNVVGELAGMLKAAMNKGHKLPSE